MRTRRASAGMAMATRGKATSGKGVGRPNVLEVPYVSVPKRVRSTPKKSKTPLPESFTDDEAAPSSSTRVSTAPPKSISSVRNAKPIATPIAPAQLSARESATPVRASTRIRKPTAAALAANPKHHEDASDVADLKRKRASLEEETSSFREECRKEERALKQRKIAIEKEERRLQGLKDRLNSRSDKLDAQEESLHLREEEAQRHWVDVSVEMSKRTLRHMEESFNCSMCCDVMAYPTSLASYCGHTFCALCIIKWYFTNFHDDCSNWHVAVECPLCRAPIRTPQTRASRNIESFPFGPNKTAESSLDLLVESLALPVETGQASSSNKGKKKKKAVKDTDDVAWHWREGGMHRKDWDNRSELGKAKLVDLMQRWPKLSPAGFLMFKQSLDA